MTKRLEDEEERAASHEAGHAIVSIHLEVPFDSIEINAAGEGFVHLPNNIDVEESFWSELARRQVIVAYAGAAAQRMLHPEQPEGEIMQCSHEDRDKIHNIATEFPTVQKGKEAEAIAKSLVHEFRGVIEETSKKLLKHKKLTAEEVKRIYSKGGTMQKDWNKKH